MNRRFVQGGIAIAAAVMLHPALADKDDPPEFTPLSIVQRPDSFDECHAETAGNLAMGIERRVELTIAADGTLKKFSLPEGSPQWMKDLSGCAIKQFRFSPATLNGRPEETGAFLTVKFRVSGPDQPAGIAIEKVGPFITPPRIWSRSKATNTCYPESIDGLGIMSRFVVTVIILPDGSLGDLTLPVGSESWQEETARCVLRRLTLLPGTKDGVPVETQASLPIAFRYASDEVIASTLRSTAEELEAAYRACYPPDLFTMTSVSYSFDIGSNGRVIKPKVIKGSGDPRLDEAGACILKMLKFTPLIVNGRGIRSSATWELPLRPHR